MLFRSFPFTLVMLSLLIAVVSQVIGDHIARAFSLVGALSIVRFRTVVDDTQDIAFVIFAVVVGMAIGTGNWMVAVLGLICVGGVVILSKQFWGQASSGKSSLSFKTAVGDANVDAVQSLLKDFGIQCRVIAVESARNGAILEWKYELVGSRTNRQTQELMTRLAGLEGIQAVAWKSTD